MRAPCDATWRDILTLGFDEEDQGRMRDLAERNQEGALSRRGAGGTPELRQGRAPARPAPLQGEEIAEGRGRGPEDSWTNRWPGRYESGRARLRVLPDAPGMLSHRALPDRPYHRPPTRRGDDARQPALSCLHDNSHKGPNIAGMDPLTGKLTKLFNPRRHKWERHFRWDGAYLVGRTGIGRTTVAVLAMNDPDVIRVRRSLIDEGLFPRSRSRPIRSARPGFASRWSRVRRRSSPGAIAGPDRSRGRTDQRARGDRQPVRPVARHPAGSGPRGARPGPAVRREPRCSDGSSRRSRSSVPSPGIGVLRTAHAATRFECGLSDAAYLLESVGWLSCRAGPGPAVPRRQR